MIKMKKALYIHIPFCDHICGYCDFARGYYSQELADKYLAALIEELNGKDLSSIETIYIGGGTPTALNLLQLETLFKALKPYTNKLVEYTIEANPESLTKAKAQLFKDYNINRVSMGMQVSQSHLLELIERKHTFKDVKDKIKILKSVGIENISVDLMYGIPNQSLEDLKTTLEKIVKLEITHVSLYALTIEPNSKFGLKGYQEASADLDADMYEYALDYLENAGFKRYEISNFAKAGYESKHNKVYWQYDDFIGAGLFASGKEGYQRYTNTRSLKEYLAGKRKDEIIALSKTDEAFEYIMMNLRMVKGFRIKNFNQRFGFDFKEKYKSQLKTLENDKLIIVENDIIKASNYGLEILHNVIEEFMNESD